jgi:hypothetical protein
MSALEELKVELKATPLKLKEAVCLKFYSYLLRIISHCYVSQTLDDVLQSQIEKLDDDDDDDHDQDDAQPVPQPVESFPRTYRVFSGRCLESTRIDQVRDQVRVIPGHTNQEIDLAFGQAFRQLSP